MSAKRVFETTFNTYTEVGVLGEGGAGRVYEVSDVDGQSFALKLLHAASTQQRKRFSNEIAFCSKQSSRHIVAVLDHGVIVVGEKRCPFYVMPLFAGTLRSLLDRGLPHERVLPYFGQILDGVEAAHMQKVTHRDIKPENILCDTRSDVLIVADFGIARFTEETLLTAVETRSQDRLANFLYASPEQRVKGRDVGSAADIYALGLILNEMFTREVPQGSGHKRIADAAPQFAYLDPMVDRMIRQSSNERPGSIAEIKQELIARGNEFVSQQKLSQLKSTVVHENEIDDPIVANPIRAIGVQYADDGRLEFELDQAPPPQWVRAFMNLGTYSALMGSEPRTFEFRGNHALVPVRGGPGAMQVVTDHFKNYVRSTNESYTAELVESVKRQAETQRKALRQQIEREEAQQRMRETVKSIKL
jgi:serine/threonine protein kinase